MFYVDSDGTRLKGDLFSVGSGSTFAYGVLDQGYSWDLSDEDAQELGRRSIYAAGHRDAFSGNSVNLFHVRENGWEFVSSVYARAAVSQHVLEGWLTVARRLPLADRERRLQRPPLREPRVIDIYQVVVVVLWH